MYLKKNNSDKDLKKFKSEIFRELKKDGFIINKNRLEHNSSKKNLRNLHESAVENMRNKYRKTLEKKENELIKYIANGDDISPENIDPELILIDSSSKYWDLFNYVKIHWSIPISNGYGRRLCYIVFDKNTKKAMGILGLADPVFCSPHRDQIIGWNKSQKNSNMSKLMDGFVIGSLPPYNMILGGKLIASLLFSNQIRKDFYHKYNGLTSLISGKVHSGDLVLITTLSALGKSSMYDRIKLPNGQKYISIGYSEGYGEFHFNGEIYKKMTDLVLRYRPPSIKKEAWGEGFRNKREVIQKALSILEISLKYNKHGIKREQFIIPLAKNYQAVLCQNKKPHYYNTPFYEVTEYMKKRWIIPRAQRNLEYKKWRNEDYILWSY